MLLRICSRLLFLSVAFATAAASAQGRPMLRTRQMWDGLRLVSWNGPEATIQCAGVKDEKHRLPGGYVLQSIRDGWAYAATLQGPPSQPRVPTIYRSHDWTRWDKVGAMPSAAEARLRGVFPLKDDRFLVYQSMDTFHKDGEASFLAIARLKDEVLTVEELVNPGVRVFQPMPPKQKPESWSPVPVKGMDEVLQDIATGSLGVADGQPYLMLPSLGQILFFSPERGHVTRSAVLYDFVMEQIKAGHKPGWSLLAARPLPSGDLIIAARGEDAVRMGRKVIPDSAQADAPEDASAGQEFMLQEKAQEGARGKRLAAFPELLWFRVDPKEGVFRAYAQPPSLPDRITSLEAFESFGFRVDVKGALVYGD